MLKLSPQEQRVRDLLCQGYRNKEMAEKVGINYRTIEVYRAAVFRKYGVTNAVQLVHKVLAENEGPTDE